MKVLTILFALISVFSISGNSYAGTAKQDVCHKGKTINISSSAAPAHVNHGDQNYACKSVPRAVALFQCGGIELRITAISTTFGLPQQSNFLTVGSSCAGSIRLLMNNGFTPIHIDSVYDATLSGVVTNYGYSGPQVLSAP